MSLTSTYRSYKPSGEFWLGDIPQEWTCEPLKHVAKLNTEKVLPEGTVRYVGMENVQSDNGRFNPTLEQMPEGLSLEFREHDVLFGKLRPYLAKSWEATFDGICSSEFLVLSALKVSPRFLNYVTLSREFVEVVDSSTYGAKMPRASWDFIGALKIPVPGRELSEQIAAFLDYETAKIDALIEKQQQLIALLGEKRQAVISHAVTKGLNPDAPLIKSGIKWAPEVPAHWSLVPNRSLFRIRRVLVGQRHSEYQLLSLTKQGVIVRDLSTGDGKHSDYMERCQEVRPGDVVFCLFDVEETPRTIGLSNHLGMTSGDYTIMECSDGLAARFVEYFYIAMDDRKLLRPLYRGLRKRIPKPGFLAARIPLPPAKEQELIVQHLDDMQVKLERLVEAAHNQVELLQERRTALISAAVTGKIDVRGWKPPSSGGSRETEMEVA